MSEEYTPFKMKGFPTIQGTSPAKQVSKLAAKVVRRAKNIIDKDKKSEKSKGLNEIDTYKGQEAASDAYDKVKYSARHGSKLKDKKGWTQTPGTNTWTNDAYEAKKENRKASEAASKARADEDAKNRK
jgi:hypothetical protein